MNRGTICAEERTFRLLPFRGNNCGLIPLLSINVSIVAGTTKIQNGHFLAKWGEMGMFLAK